MNIDWQLLSRAISFYEGLGYTYVEVPWAVSRDIAQKTFPGDPVHCDFGALVGSAEQGFLTLPDRPGAKLVSCSPCFRNEPVLNHLYQRWFMKVELYREGSHLDAVVAAAFAFHDEIARDPILIDTPEGRDIMVNGIEVGSYGVRTVGDRTWTYGTGLALPRFTVAFQRRPLSCLISPG